MKIALVTDTFYPQVGGTESVVLSLANAYTKLGHNVAIFTRNYKLFHEDSTFKFPIYRTKVHKFPFYPEIPLPNKDEELNSNLIKFKPDVIHAHTPFEMGKWGVSKAKELNIKSVLTTHTYLNYINEQNVPFSKNNVIHKTMVKIATHMPKQTALRADTLTAVSEYVKQKEIENVYGIKNKTTVVKNGFDYAHLNEVLKNVSIEPLEYYKNHIDDKIHLCFVGRIVKEKNIQFSLNVCKLLKEKDIPFDFTSAGDGDISYFSSVVSSLDIQENVKFIGKKGFSELVQLYAKSDVLLFPSIFDCDSIVGIESRAVGCPSLVIENTGSAERITDGVNGYVLSNKEECFVNKIEELHNIKMNNVEQMIKFRDTTLTKRVDSWETVATKYLDIYDSLKCL